MRFCIPAHSPAPDSSVWNGKTASCRAPPLNVTYPSRHGKLHQGIPRPPGHSLCPANSGFGKGQEKAGAPSVPNSSFRSPPQGAGNVPCQGKSQAYAGFPAVSGFLCAPERLEYQLAVLGGNAGTVVPEADDDIMAVRLDGQLDFGVFPLGVFDGVGSQVVHDLLHSHGVRMDGQDAGWAGPGQRKS